MPLLDVEDGFDPEFIDRVIVLRRPEMIAQTGRVDRNAIDAASPVEVDAVVGAESGRTVRDEDYQIAGKVIQVTTDFRLRGPTPGYQPDIVVIDAIDDDPAPFAERYAANPTAFDHYTVTDVRDFSRYGTGFVVATCEVIELEPAPPTTELVC